MSDTYTNNTNDGLLDEAFLLFRERLEQLFTQLFGPPPLQGLFPDPEVRDQLFQAAGLHDQLRDRLLRIPDPARAAQALLSESIAYGYSYRSDRPDYLPLLWLARHLTRAERERMQPADQAFLDSFQQRLEAELPKCRARAGIAQLGRYDKMGLSWSGAGVFISPSLLLTSAEHFRGPAPQRPTRVRLAFGQRYFAEFGPAYYLRTNQLAYDSGQLAVVATTAQAGPQPAVALEAEALEGVSKDMPIFWFHLSAGKETIQAGKVTSTVASDGSFIHSLSIGDDAKGAPLFDEQFRLVGICPGAFRGVALVTRAAELFALPGVLPPERARLAERRQELAAQRAALQQLVAEQRRKRDFLQGELISASDSGRKFGLTEDLDKLGAELKENEGSLAEIARQLTELV